jgi:hypothetical protein
VILVVYGGLGILYAPLLAGGAAWTFLGVGVSLATIPAVLSVATGIGLLRLHGWARLAAGLLAAYGLVFVDMPALIATASNGAWTGFDWLGAVGNLCLGIVGNLVVLFAVLRRWPNEPAAAD